MSRLGSEPETRHELDLHRRPWPFGPNYHSRFRRDERHRPQRRDEVKGSAGRARASALYSLSAIVTVSVLGVPTE